MNPRIINVVPMEEYKLLLIFSNNEFGIFDVVPYLHDRFWSSLKENSVFLNVKVSGGSIEWANGIDLCPDEVYENTKMIGKILSIHNKASENKQ